MMNRYVSRLLFVISVLSLIILSACDSGSGGGSQDGDVSVYTGSDGVSIELKDTRPVEVESIFEEEFSVNFENKGPSDADIRVKISGYDPNQFEITPKGDAGADSIFLEKRPLEHASQGTEGTLDVNLKLKQGFDQTRFTGPQSYNLKIHACYEYNTHYQKKFCISGDGREKYDGTQVCNPSAEEYRSDEGQGSPVVIQGVDYSTNALGGDKVRHEFSILVKKGRGTGEGIGELGVYDVGYSPCDDHTRDEEKQSEDKVEVSSVKLGDRELDCKFRDGESKEGVIDVEESSQAYDDQIRALKCRIELDKQKTFEGTLFVDLKYDVEDFVMQKMTFIPEEE